MLDVTLMINYWFFYCLLHISWNIEYLIRCCMFLSLISMLIECIMYRSLNVDSFSWNNEVHPEIIAKEDSHQLVTVSLYGRSSMHILSQSFALSLSLCWVIIISGCRSNLIALSRMDLFNSELLLEDICSWRVNHKWFSWCFQYFIIGFAWTLLNWQISQTLSEHFKDCALSTNQDELYLS